MPKIPLNKKSVKPKNHGKHFIPIFTGLFDYLNRGDISYQQLGLYLTIHSQADFSTGLWWGSAPRLLNCGPRGSKLREIQRDLDRLVQIGLLKHFHRQGSRGNFSVIINKFICRTGALTGMRLNAAKSTSSEKLVYEPCAEDTLTAVNDRAENGSAPPHLQELKNLEVQEVQELKKKKKPKAPPPEVIQLLAYLEKQLSTQLSGWGWHEGQTKPELHAIHQWFKLESKVQGIDWRKAERLYNQTIAEVRKQLEPTNRVGPGPITEELIAQWAAEAASDPDVQEIIRDGGGSALTLVYANGIEEHHLGADEPDWFPFDDVVEKPEIYPQILEPPKGLSAEASAQRL
jgi:hypothetical protein